MAGPAAGQETPDALRAEAFEAAQWAIASDAAEAVAKLSARFAQGGGEVAALADQREKLLDRRDSLERQIESAYGEGAEAGAKSAALRALHDTVLVELKGVDAEIEKRFPAYAELTSPKAVPLREVQQLLGPREALVLVLVNAESTYVWGVSRDRVEWARAADLGAEPLADLVSGLRRSVSRSTSATRGAALDDAATGAPVPAQAAGFRLYDRLIRPVEAAFNGADTLIVVATGPLTSLPPAVLVTRDIPAGQSPGPSDYLIDRYALASLPAVSSLKALRCYLGRGAKPAICPTLPKPASVQVAAAPLSLLGFGAPTLLGRGDGRSGGDVVVRGLADPEALRKLAYLKGSLSELETLKTRIDGAQVFTGDAATETAVRATYRDDMARAQTIVFSTHGLVAGSAFSSETAVGGLAEPGLVFTPPGTATSADDGFLSASEAAELRLTADFVVLSACNTAAPDGRAGAEGLSGLARAFFFAGARSVLVSHWEVSDQATSALIVHAISATQDKSIGGRAKALRSAMLKVRAEPGFANPYFWAPFTLVGEAST